MGSNLILYCQKTWLDLEISKMYFSDRHYCWVTSDFNNNPNSSNPKHRYQILKSDIESSDSHSYMIKENKTGIKYGASLMKSNGIISNEQESEIIEIVESASLLHFKPQLLIIPYEIVKDVLVTVKPRIKASSVSSEYIIENLTRDKFDIIEY